MLRARCGERRCRTDMHHEACLFLQAIKCAFPCDAIILSLEGSTADRLDPTARQIFLRVLGGYTALAQIGRRDYRLRQPCVQKRL